MWFVIGGGGGVYEMNFLQKNDFKSLGEVEMTNTYCSDAVRKTKTYSCILVMNRKCHNAMKSRNMFLRYVALKKAV